MYCNQASRENECVTKESVGDVEVGGAEERERTRRDSYAIRRIMRTTTAEGQHGEEECEEGKRPRRGGVKRSTDAGRSARRGRGIRSGSHGTGQKKPVAVIALPLLLGQDRGCTYLGRGGRHLVVV